MSRTVMSSVAMLSDVHGVLSGVDPSVSTIVRRHTHMPFQRLTHRRLIVNPGSVGMPYGRGGAHWALLRDGVVHLRVMPYDVEAACAEIVATDDPDAAAWAEFFIRSPAGDAVALTTFAPRDGRDGDAQPR
jgi:diadenosine tetraphosphatase ApaH/serine/threonine PP2A family protein phosphatase